MANSGYRIFNSSDRTLSSILLSDNNHRTVNGFYTIVVDEQGRLPSGATLVVLDKGQMREVRPDDLQSRDWQSFVPPQQDSPDLGWEKPPQISGNEFADVPGGSIWDEEEEY